MAKPCAMLNQLAMFKYLLDMISDQSSRHEFSWQNRAKARATSFAEDFGKTNNQIKVSSVSRAVTAYWLRSFCWVSYSRSACCCRPLSCKWSRDDSFDQINRELLEKNKPFTLTNLKSSAFPVFSPLTFVLDQ